MREKEDDIRDMQISKSKKNNAIWWPLVNIKVKGEILSQKIVLEEKTNSQKVNTITFLKWKI